MIIDALVNRGRYFYQRGDKMAKQKVNKKITPIQRQYMEEARRVKRIRDKLWYQGYRFERSPIPAQPKRITEASLRKLQNITTESLIKKSKYVESFTGEALYGRKKTAYQPQAQRIYLEKIEKEIMTFAPPHLSPHLADLRDRNNHALLGILTNAIARDGEEAVARRVSTTAEDIANIISIIQYDSGKDVQRINSNLMRFAEIVNGGRLSYEETQQIAEMSEYFEYFDDMEEY